MRAVAPLGAALGFRPRALRLRAAAARAGRTDLVVEPQRQGDSPAVEIDLELVAPDAALYERAIQGRAREVA